LLLLKGVFVFRLSPENMVHRKKTATQHLKYIPRNRRGSAVRRKCRNPRAGRETEGLVAEWRTKATMESNEMTAQFSRYSGKEPQV